MTCVRRTGGTPGVPFRFRLDTMVPRG